MSGLWRIPVLPVTMHFDECWAGAISDNQEDEIFTTVQLSPRHSNLTNNVTVL